MIRLSLSDRIIGITVAVLLAINSGCGAALRTTPIAPQAAPYCFAIVIDRTGEYARGCTATAATCARIAGMAQRFHGIAGIKHVSGCEEQP
jgi:hypothetical protein